MFLSIIFFAVVRGSMWKVETKDAEVVAYGAMKVCVFYYCLICVSIPIWPFSNCCEVQAKEDEVATWRCKEGYKMTVCRAIGVCIFYYYLFFYQWSPFHAVVRCKPKKTKLWHAERRYVFSVVKYIISFSLLLRYKRRRRSDGMWSNESMHFLLLLFNSRLSIGLITTFNSRILLPSNAHVEQWKQLPYSLVP